MKQLNVTLVLFVLALSFTAPVMPVLAQDEFECVYDWEDGEQGWVDYTGFGGSGTIWDAGGYWHNPGANYPEIVLFFPETFVDSVEVTFDQSGNRGDAPDSDLYIYTDAAPYVVDNPPGMGQVVEVPVGEDTDRIIFGVGSDDATNNKLHAITITGEGNSPCAAATLTYPLAQQDRATVFLDHDDREGTNLRANLPDAKVSAATSGTVTSVRQMVGAECTSLELPGGICTMSYNGTIYTLLGAFAENWVVEITTGLFTVEQLVRDAPLYVEEGQNVRAGCWIGTTLRLQKTFFSVDDTPDPAVFAPDITILWTRDTDYFSNEPTLEPVDAAPCNTPEGYEGCLGDNRLSDPGAWSQTGGITWESPGATLSPGAGISAVMNLDSEREPELVAGGVGFGGTPVTLRLQLGETADIFDFSSGSATIPADEHTPDAGAFFTVSVRNTGGAIIRLDYLCIRHTLDSDGDPVDPPGNEPGTPGGDPPEQSACTFSNSSFNDGTANWTVVSGDAGAGEVLLTTGGTIAQNVTVAAGTYNLTVVTALWSYNSYSPDDQDTDDVDLEYDFGAGSTALDTHTYGEFAQHNNLIVFQTSVVVASDTTDDFIIEATLNSPPSGVRGLAIRSVCLGTGDDGTFDPGEESGGLFEATCSVISTPTGNAISTWISWLWAKLNQFYRCELIRLLNNTYQVIQAQYRIFQWSLLYQQAASQKVLTWFARDFVNWLGGHFNNIAMGRTTTIEIGGVNCDNLFCALDSLFGNIAGVLNNLLTGIQNIGTGLITLGQTLLDGLVTLAQTLLEGLITLAQTLLDALLPPLVRIVDTLLAIFVQSAQILFSTVTLALSVLYTLLAQIFGLVGLGFGLLNALLVAWNAATPIAIPGVPSCAADPQGNPLCVGIWVLENTVFASPAGQIIIPAAVGMLSIWILLWVIERLRRAAIDSANAI